MTKKKIVDIKVINAGSNPDVDSDFHTFYRNEVLEYTTETYGKGNVSNIITFGTLAAKGAIKAMCTIYRIPFAQANKIASLVPPPIEGRDCSLDDIYNPDSDRYDEAGEFREAVSGSMWKPIIEGALNIEGRNKSTGMHACGVLISSQELYKTIPLQVRKEDNRVLTQWTYQECESLGLIKMDFLGLDTIDLIHDTINHIIRSGKEAPNMTKLVQTDMDDPNIYKMFHEGNTIGIFQFGSEMVRKNIRAIKPNSFAEIAATTAILRPGPMNMDSHVRYANIKNGLEESKPLHPDFKDSPLEEILSETFGLIVYQEQIIKIASAIAGMTLQEGDDLRKAMGKKKMKVMMQMKPKFFAGSQANGYSEEAVEILWNTIEEFAKYGFNKSHSVAYAMNSYQTAYLKTYYPVEFMASLIGRTVKDKKKTLTFLREAKRMKIKVGTVDINLSDIAVAPDYEGKSGFDVLFGISGIKDVSNDMGSIIVKEREKNGRYTSVKDLIDRCVPLGVNNKKIYESLAKSGAFDSFGVSRKQVVEHISDLVDSSKSSNSKGMSLFEMLESEELEPEIDLTGEEYNYIDKLQSEADVVGFYLTGNPLHNIGKGSSKIANTDIAHLKKNTRQVTATILGTIVELDVRKKRTKTILASVDDGNDSIDIKFDNKIVKALDKWTAQENLKKNYINGENKISPDALRVLRDDDVIPQGPIKLNTPYIINVTYRTNREGGYVARANSVKPLILTDNGTLPIRIRFKANKGNLDRVKELKRRLPLTLQNRYSGEYPIQISVYSKLYKKQNVEDILYKQAISNMLEDDKNNVDRKIKPETPKDNSPKNLFGNDSKATSSANSRKKKASSKEKVTARIWPPEVSETVEKIEALTVEDIAESIEELKYVDTEFMADKTQDVEQFIEKYVGIENYDFGYFDKELLINRN